ncbi:patatin-like phospholipase family protein [Pelagimonas sp. KU-00592-HH]|uniref:patatin-like phospholipase family protein n=1 Tax=Roseobacteraceae TaxID=2854170 RepID=UPI0020CC0A19|nr:patatin-like phospholipase family protein [Shimia sp. CNT1-13L.2]MCP9480711.1 patatin-like phospholipase family protein [Shimia sp. CNT1-13L.2]
MRAKVWAIVFSVLLVAGCDVARHNREAEAPPADRYEDFQPVGAEWWMRIYEDASDEDFRELIKYYEAKSGQWPNGRDGLNILALSGGGQDGAFGAGVLHGWSQSGKRPEFDMVTGISTGALIAPFAFLGPEYDDRLKELYTETSTQDIANFDVAGAVFGSGYLASTKPMANAIREHLTPEVLRAVAEESRKGRSLLIGTTNIDAERPVLWDIGAIAEQETPEAYQLIRRVVQASASIPIAFEPVRIPVRLGDIERTELHVDGGLTREIFVYPAALDMRRVLRRVGASGHNNTIWLLHNKRLEKRYAAQDTRLLKMGERTFEMLIRSQSLGNIDTILSLAARDGFRAHLLSIPASFEAKPREAFDRVYMGELFDLGAKYGRDPGSWRRDQQKAFQ